MDILAADEHLMLVIVDGHFTDRVGALAGDFAVRRGGSRVADGGAHACEQLGGAERLGQVVVRAEIERLHLVVLVRAGGNHHHRQARPRAQLAQDVNAVHVRQTEIEDDQIRTVRGDHGLRLAARAGQQRFVVVGV